MTVPLYLAIGTSNTSLTLGAASIFPPTPGVVQIGTEQIHYTISTDTQLLGLTRAYNSTSAAAHAAGAAVSFVSTDTPATGAAWGSITGTLGAQSDLDTSLGTKAPTVSPTFTTSMITGTQPMIIKPSVDGVNAINFTKADGVTSVFSINTSDGRIGIGTTTPAKQLVVNDLNIGNQLAMGPASASAACLIDMVNPYVGCGMPCMTTAQKNAVSPHRAGNVVFDTDLGKLCVDNGASWETVTSA